MKRILYVLPLALIFMASCGGCNTSSPEGAADCACDLGEDMMDAFKDGDADKLKDVSEKMQKWEQEVEGHIDAGDYTENDVEAALKERNCKM